MNILAFYNSRYTYINTVFEHISSFSKYSKHKYFFSHLTKSINLDTNLSRFDAIVWHYTIRLPFDEVSKETAKQISEYKGLKVLFIQDEYDHTHRAWYWIKRLGFNLVFTVVPEKHISYVYPQKEFSDVIFRKVLTGYVPSSIPDYSSITPPSKRDTTIGYRGRQLPIRYGKLCQEKTQIGELVLNYGKNKDFKLDIGIKDESRIYGPAWDQFLLSCRAVLGTESGSNVFDWDGVLDAKVNAYRQSNQKVSDQAIYRNIIQEHEVPGLMNQISPRIFEAISLRTALVLFEGDYSGIIQPGRHYIPLKKDGSNLDLAFSLIEDDDYLDNLTDNVYNDVITPGKYTYQSFINYIDKEIEKAYKNFIQDPVQIINKEIPLSTERNQISVLTTNPINSHPPKHPKGSIILFKSIFGSLRYPVRSLKKVYFKLKSILKKYFIL